MGVRAALRALYELVADAAPEGQRVRRWDLNGKVEPGWNFSRGEFRYSKIA
jgi:hypothetical protein